MLRASARQEAIDPVPVHVDNLESVLTSFEHVARARYAAERKPRQAAERVILLPLLAGYQRFIVQRARDRIDAERAIEQPASVITLHSRERFARLARNVTDDRRHHVRKTDDAFHVADITRLMVPVVPTHEDRVAGHDP